MAATLSAPEVLPGRVASGKMSAEAAVMPSSVEHLEPAAGQAGGVWPLEGHGPDAFEGFPSSVADMQDMTDEGASVLLSLAASQLSRGFLQESPGEAGSLTGEGIIGQQAECKLEQSLSVGATVDASMSTAAAAPSMQEAEEKQVVTADDRGHTNDTLPAKAQAGNTQLDSPLPGVTPGTNTLQHSSKAQAGISSRQYAESAHPGQHSLKAQAGISLVPSTEGAHPGPALPQGLQEVQEHATPAEALQGAHVHLL